MIESTRARRAGAAAISGTAALLLCGSAATACPALTGTVGSIVTQGGCGPIDCPPADCAVGSTRGGGNHATMGTTDRGGLPFAIAMVDFTFTPNAPVIKPNTVVRWTNNGLFQHTTTRTPTWDSGLVNPNQFFDRNFPGTEAGLAFDYVCTLHFGMEGTVGVAHFGDANLDGFVNLNDFNTLAANFGQTERTWEQGDFNEDGTVNLNDFNLLASNFGKEIEPASLTITFDFGAGSALVPEPIGAASLLALLPVLIRRTRRAD
jgi:plastocyanin